MRMKKIKINCSICEKSLKQLKIKTKINVNILFTILILLYKCTIVKFCSTYIVDSLI